MGVVTRFGVSLEETLLQHFDRLIRRKGYTNRSEALRDLIRESLVREQWDLGTSETVGTLTLVYNHEVRELADKLTDLQHEYFRMIVSTLRERRGSLPDRGPVRGREAVDVRRHRGQAPRA